MPSEATKLSRRRSSFSQSKPPTTSSSNTTVQSQPSTHVSSTSKPRPSVNSSMSTVLSPIYSLESNYRCRFVTGDVNSAKGHQKGNAGSRRAECSPPAGGLPQPSGSPPAAARRAGGSEPRGGAARRGPRPNIGPSRPRSRALGALFFSVTSPPPAGFGGDRESTTLNSHHPHNS